MTLNVTAFEDAVHAWVKACSGLADNKVIFSHQDAPDPRPPYITITTIEDADTLGMYPEQGMNEDGEVTSLEHWRIEGCVEAWGTGARQALLTFKAKAYLPTFYALLQTANIAAHLGDLTFLPAVKTQQWEEHAKIPVLFHYSNGDTVDDGAPDGDGTPQPLGYFDQVEYSGPDITPHPIPSTTVTADD